MSRAPSETLRAVLSAALAGLEPLRAEPPQSLSVWAGENYKLSRESSHKGGDWEAYPFQRGWMDAFSNDAIPEVNVRKSKRVGYTKTVGAFVAYNAAHRRRKQAVWQPTDDDRDSFVKTEIDPMVRDVAAVKRVLLSGKDDSLKLKKFMGSHLHMLGGKAARAFRRITVAVAILDEASAFDQLVEKRVDPIEGARGRLEGAPFPKLILGSTPSIKGFDHVETREANADAVMRYQVVCPHCQVEHPLLWGGKGDAHGIKGGGLGGDAGPVRHLCPHCRGAITQGDYLRVWGQGAWVSDCGQYRYGADSTWRDAQGQPRQPPRHVAFCIWAAYSPQRSWEDIVREFLEAKRKADQGVKGPLMTFVNETLGECWEEEADRADEHALQARAEDYPLAVVPIGALVLTAGIDLQGNRWELGVWGWGPGMESWDIDHHIIEGNAQSDEDWLQVEQYLVRRYPQAWHGGTLGIESISIDSNYQTQAVFNFVRRMQHRVRIHAVRGEGTEGLPIKGPGRAQEVNWRGQRWPAGIKQWAVGVDSAKDMLHDQLQLTHAGPGFVHLNKNRPREWFEQLTAEQRVHVRTATGTGERWLKRRPRNEVLDCRNYALHAAYMLGLPTWSDKRWDQQLQAVQPPRDLFAPQPDSVAATAPSNGAASLPARPVAPPPVRKAPATAVAGGRQW